MPKKKAPAKKTAKKKAQASALTGVTKVKSKGVTVCPTEIPSMAQQYADLVLKSESKTWTWMDIKSSTGETAKRSQQSKIRKYAVDNFGVPEIPVDKNKFPDFTGYVAFETVLPKSFHKNTSDPVQFREADKAVKALHPNYDEATNSFPPDKKRYTWHHHQGPPDGKMQLVEFGVHNATNHKGGRTTWATGSR
jgi:toxin YxiD